MKKHLLIIVLTCCFLSAFSQDLSYFLPQGDFSYNPNIPTPKQFFGHELGEQHVTYDLAYAYFKELSQKSERVVVQERGRTYQYRPIMFLFISTPNNLAHLEEIRQNHLQLCDYKESDQLNVENMPVVTWLGYSVHGNEASGINASIAVAYFLSAAMGTEVDRILSSSVVIMQPGANPDGIQRFATWVNNARSFTPVKDPNSREFREPTPGSRSNHYWFDLNRDWIVVQHPESYFRAQLLYEWHPTLFSDFHEHGGTGEMFFSPGIETRHNPSMPKDSYDFMSKIAQSYHVKFLNSLGTLTYSKESYDGWFTGCGDALPHLLGGVAFLFEQPSARGHIQEINGVTIRFSDAIRNQAYGSYSTLNAAVDMKDELLDYQRRAYKEAQKQADKAIIKGYVFGNPQNRSLDIEFHRILQANHIQVYQLNKDITAKGKTFKGEHSYIVPCNQQEFRVMSTIFETNYAYIDSVFYGLSTWTVPLSFSMNYTEVYTTAGLVGEKVECIAPSSFEAPPMSDFAYIFEIKDFYSYKFLHRILSKGIKVRVSEIPFKRLIDGKQREFDYGALMIPLSGQQYGKDELYRYIVEAAKDVPVEVLAAQGGWGSPIDLGSPRFKEITLPKIALIWGQGATSDGVGAIWHLLDQRMEMPATLLESSLLANSNVDLTPYNIIVLFGNFRFEKSTLERLKNWSDRSGNTIIGIGQAFNVLNEAGLTKISTIKRAEYVNNNTYLDFSTRTDADANATISGVILENYLDHSHPIAYGIGSNTINTIKTIVNIFSKPKGKYMSPVYYLKNPLLSGCITDRNLELLSETPSVFASRNVIYFAEDPCFRAHWFGSMRLLLNSFFFREMMPREKLETVSD